MTSFSQFLIPFSFFSFFTAFDRSYKTQFENKLLAKILYTRFIHLSPFWVQKETCLCSLYNTGELKPHSSLLPRHVRSVHCAVGSVPLWRVCSFCLCMDQRSPGLRGRALHYPELLARRDEHTAKGVKLRITINQASVHQTYPQIHRTEQHAS